MNLNEKRARRLAIEADLRAAYAAGDAATAATLMAEDATLESDIAGLEAVAARLSKSQNGSEVEAPVAPVAPVAQTAGDLVIATLSKNGYVDNPTGRSANIKVSATRALAGTDVSTDTIAPLEGRGRDMGFLPTLPQIGVGLLGRFDQQFTDEYASTYVQEIVGENTAAFVAQGGSKPLQGFEYVEVTSHMRTVAAAAVITRQALRSPRQIAGTVNGRLTQNLNERCEAAAVNGTGGAQVQGILNLANRNVVVAEAGAATDGAKMVAALRRAKTQTLVNGRVAADTIAVNPEDFEVIELARADNGSGQWLVSPNVRDGAAPVLWGIEVIETMSLAKGTAIVGAFRTATVWRRDNTQYFATDSHEGFFLENKVVLLAEQELSIEYYRPQAFSEVRFTAAA